MRQQIIIMEKIVRKVLKKIVPSKKERETFEKVLAKVVKTADDVIKPYGLEKTITGSFIRDTWLTDKREVDLFILFPEEYPREKLEKDGLALGKKIIKKLGGRYEIAYAEHPYVKGKFEGFNIDIVPCYKVASASQIKSAVDRTPFHNEYIMKNLKPEMTNEVRLLKQFCKASGIYGSDIRTQGFSGYLCELLIIKYKTFINLVKNAKDWDFGVFIDLEKHSKFTKDDERFKGQPLIVIDPTDPKRNVAASLSPENFIKFVEKCRVFVENPSVSFFEIKKKMLTKKMLKRYLKKRGTYLFIIRFKRPNVVDDILWSQMRKTSVRLSNLLKEYDFEVFEKDVWADEKYAYLIFEMKTFFLPPLKIVRGPPIYSKKHVEEFRKKYGKKAYIEGNRWFAEIKREYVKCTSLVKDFLKKSEKKLLVLGVRSYLAKEISKGFNILEGDKIEKLLEKNKELSVFLRSYFDKANLKFRQI